MQEFKANERTFQGVLLNTFQTIIIENDDIKFESVFQEQNVGVGESRFSDTIITSSVDSKQKVFVELKPTSWDAQDEILVTDAAQKAFNNGVEYFVTGTPRQLIIYKTFIEGTPLLERKLKLYQLSSIKTDNDVLAPSFQKQINPVVTQFLKDLSDIVHGITELHWDSVDKIFVNKLSAYILDASSVMFEVMSPKIKDDDTLKKKIRDYIAEQEIFNVGIKFTDDDIYNLCQLANYLLYLKIIFYSYLERDVKSLGLKPLKIPQDKDLLNKTLRARFDDVLQHDYESIFQKTILDEFEYPNSYLPELQRNVDHIRRLKFHDFNCDIIGSIYNKLIDSQEQHQHGQHFTNTNEVDIVNAFCINKNTKLVFDSGCGAGTFLVRAYAFMKHFNNKLKHKELLERLWGIDIAPFPVFLANMNLALLNIKEIDNYPSIINKDFGDVRPKSFHKLIFHNHTKEFETIPFDNKHVQVRIPQFDACVGNPPYIMQELIDDKSKWSGLLQAEHRIKKIDQRSDLYVYFLMHTATFLKEGGRFGYVISSSWLDNLFGASLQKFLLDHFKIIAVVENQKVRSFDTASINTIIFILEKCSDQQAREGNNVRFVRVYKEYKELIGRNDDEERFTTVIDFAAQIEKTSKSIKNDDYFITVRNQKLLEEESTVDGKYEPGNWGAKYLRSPEIYNKIIETAGSNLIPLYKVAEVKYGIKSGANDFFYVVDDTDKVKEMSDEDYKLTFGFERKKHLISWEKNGWFYSEMTKSHHILERIYFKPLFKTQKEAKNLEVDLEKLKFHVLVCNDSLKDLKKYNTRIVKYIELAEKEHGMHEVVTNSARISNDKNNPRDWFNLGKDLFVGDFIFPSKIGEKFRLIDNRKTNVYCDKVNYNIKVGKGYSKEADIIFLILNGTLFRYFIDLFSRQLTGNQTLSDVDVYVVENTFIIDPKLLKPKEKELEDILEVLKGREQKVIYEDVKQKDRIKLDKIIFEALGMKAKDVEELHKEACNYVKERELKSGSVTTVKSKQKPDYETSLKLIQERFPEIHIYNDLIKGKATIHFNIPNLPAKFPKDMKTGDGNLFQSYFVIFKDGNKQISVGFKNTSQIKLFRFFYEELEVKGKLLTLPEKPEDCEKVFTILESEYKKNNSQIKAMLKSYRSKASFLAIYRDLILG
ncbi:MAG: SAM-dependent DNA methyltransferase [Melioribacter sp.]|nr:SAM-dependent DNA methyltransferase [Melioribacter sp.]